MHHEIIRTLTDISHIPHLKKNFISRSSLDSSECKYTNKDGVIRVSKGTLFVMKAQKVVNLCVL